MTLALIARLEKLDGPDREVDHAIWYCVTPESDPSLPEKTDLKYAPRYTSSLDAALTLLPGEAWEWEMTRHDEKCYAKVGDPLLYLEGEAATPAIAFCIAALKAIARMAEQEAG